MGTMIRTCRREVLIGLLLELDEICRKNNLKYSLTGRVANAIGEENKFPDAFDFLTVAMTQGDIDKFIKIVNDQNSHHRQVEYFLNNPNAIGLQIRYCNSDTTLINVKQIGNHVNYGMYIKIKPIEKIPTSKIRSKFLRFLKLAWKGSKKRLDSCNYKRFLPVLILKGIVQIVGKKNFSRFLYNYNKKLKYIDNWEEIACYEKVRIGRGIFSGELLYNLNEINIEGCSLLLSPALMHRIIEKNPTHKTVAINDIEDVNIPFQDIMNSHIVENMYQTQKIRNQYLRIVTLANKPASVMKQAWRTYLMTRDVINFEDVYNEERLQKIYSAIENNDVDTYFEEMNDYLSARKHWYKLKIPFIKNNKLEEIIAFAKNKFQSEL